MKLFEHICHTLDLTLDASEEIEYLKIANEMKLFMQIKSELSPNLKMISRLSLNRWSTLTMITYKIGMEAKEALDMALSSNRNPVDWCNAYQIAQAYDDAMQSALVEKFQHTLLPMSSASTCEFMHHNLIYPLTIYLALYQIYKSLWAIAYSQEQPPIQFNLLMQSVSWLNLFLIMLLNHQFALFSKRAISLLTSHLPSQAATVYRVAREVGVDQHLHAEERPADDNSLICQLLNRVNNADQLQHEHIDIPDELKCPITHMVMSDPVYSEDNPMRFERLALLSWLKKSPTHPYTQNLLSSNLLKRDFKIKREADLFVESNLMRIKEERKRESLLKPSLFHQNRLNLKDDADDLDIAENGLVRGAGAPLSL